MQSVYIIFENIYMQIENQLKIKIMKPNCYKQSKNLSCLYTNGGSIYFR